MIKLERNLGITEIVEVAGKLYGVQVVHNTRGYVVLIQEATKTEGGYKLTQTPYNLLNTKRRNKANTEEAYLIAEQMIEELKPEGYNELKYDVEVRFLKNKGVQKAGMIYTVSPITSNVRKLLSIMSAEKYLEQGIIEIVK